ncbi:Thivi_2564 family membrane protein [Flavobacterium sp. XN-5]|uniref:Thivi_2564 family membrane protein n=1 Tax=Flavobacterium sp. XN-5 TaxID=2599390 RepID=UPI00293BD02F|nr:Thivi_2564 family membrane protein [Flavobacterium sp. XN-5]
MISIISILLVIIVTGAILWLINTYVPMDTTIKNVFNSLVVIVTAIWILNYLDLFSS